MLVTEQERERYRKAATRMQTSSLPFLIYKDGDFKLSGELEPVTDSTWLALPDKIVVGRYLFLDNRVAEVHNYFLRDLDRDPPRPDTFTDKEQWKKGSGDKPSDPWALQYTLYLVNTQTNRVVEFKATTVDTRAAVGRLLTDFQDTMRRPVVALRVKPKPENINALMPDFEIVSYSDNEEEEIPGLTIVLRDDTPVSDHPTKPRTKANGGNPDDEIPF
jgi:hypothetical protein